MRAGAGLGPAHFFCPEKGKEPLGRPEDRPLSWGQALLGLRGRGRQRSPGELPC